MPHRLMEMEIINLQRFEFKETLKIKVKKCCRLVHFTDFIAATQ